MVEKVHYVRSVEWARVRGHRPLQGEGEEEEETGEGERGTEDEECGGEEKMYSSRHNKPLHLVQWSRPPVVSKEQAATSGSADVACVCILRVSQRRGSFD